MNPIFQYDQFLLKRQVFALTGKFRLCEDIRVYADEDKTQEVLTIKARQIMDFSAAYDVVDSASGQKVGALRRKGLKSLLRDEWEVLDVSDNVVGMLLEDSMGLALLRRFLVSLIPQNYDITFGMERVADLKQRFNLLAYQLDMDFSMDTSKKLDRRIGIAAGILLAAIEGKQS